MEDFLHYSVNYREEYTIRKHRKLVGVNFLFTLVLIAYVIFGASVFLYLEKDHQKNSIEQLSTSKKECISRVLVNNRSVLHTELANLIINECIIDVIAPRDQWSFLKAVLYSFGIVTTLGYGRIGPLTTSGRVFAVVYGFLGIPVTVILFTNFGKWIQKFVQFIQIKLSRRKAKINNSSSYPSLSAKILSSIVLCYLIIGGALLSYLCKTFEFLDGVYWSFLCFTAIEYGEIIPSNHWYIPVTMLYLCTGLAISTIALDTGSAYVRRLHYIGQKIRNIANVKVWFGAKTLNVRELVNAVGQNIGVDPSLMHRIDLDNLIDCAIKVKEGKLSRVPQMHCICDGIWPPELVPLFIKEGTFPSFVDSDKQSPLAKTKCSPNSLKKSSVHSSSIVPVEFAHFLMYSPDEDKKFTDNNDAKCVNDHRSYSK